ncbi:hypothetical protein TrST_g1937 [Triparma strigata]|uniref:Uncharacterized protein n=1 Tax=Triparma strigata TaxID=1606541 RepID=A0A9W7EHL6_9STRA|nr:hypothetical protein TrST_g1937 [Triparma strigata]
MWTERMTLAMVETRAKKKLGKKVSKLHPISEKLPTINMQAVAKVPITPSHSALGLKTVSPKKKNQKKKKKKFAW